MNDTTMQGYTIMDEARQMIQNENMEQGLNTLAVKFRDLLEKSKPDDWFNFSENDFLKHPLVETIHQCPFTKHSFSKPRNYPGDAELIDYMYGYRKPGNEISATGTEIFDWVWKQTTARSVRARKQIIASMIDELAEDQENLRILSLACGHLREAHISKAVQAGKVSEYFAFDQDEISLELVKKEFAGLNIKPVHSSIKSIFTNGHQFNNLNFVYAAGLYDYLPQKIAVKLTAKMFDMLKSGGKLLVANFAPHLPDRGFGETFAAWRLIYRNEAEVSDFTKMIPEQEISGKRLFWDEPGNVIYLEVVKK